MTVFPRWVLLSAVFLAAGCAAMPDNREEPFHFDYAGASTVDRPVVVFFADGVGRAVFNRMLAEGRLPNIKRYLVDRGVAVEHAFTVMPTITHSVTTSMVTGVVPGRHGILGIHWFDRRSLIARNYNSISQKNTLDGDYYQPTIFSEPRRGWTMAIFFQPHKGATRFVENWTSAGPPYFFGWYQFVDRISAIRFSIQARIARARGRMPRLTFVHMIAPDAVGHKFGPDSEQYARAIEHADAQIGRIVRNYEEAGLLDELLLIFLSDHGMVATPRQLCVQDVLDKEFDVSVARKFLWERGTTLEKRIGYYRRFNAVVIGSGGRCMYVHLRKPKGDEGFEGWLARPDLDELTRYPTRSGRRINLVEAFARLEGIGHVLARAGARAVRVTSAAGAGLIEQDPSGRIRYAVIAGEDPLGLTESSSGARLMDGRFHRRASWIRASLGTVCAGVLWQAVDFMSCPRCGDLALFAAPGFGFADDAGEETMARYFGGHGGISADEFLVPFVLAGAGLKGAQLDTASIVDLAPTLLDYWGAVAAATDGVSVFARLERQKRRPTTRPTAKRDSLQREGAAAGNAGISAPPGSLD